MHANSAQAWNWDMAMGSCLQHQSLQVAEGMSGEKEPMFEKPLTPSDVGKLNRLVIPKQYAEKYFPLDGEAGEKGLLLSFEDENGKQWRFRYSYWTSSQSYVLTKGWSRFVKEKRLDAGDAVLFLRRHDRLYIDSRRRGRAQDFIAASPAPPPPPAMETAMRWNPDFGDSASLPSSSYLFLQSVPHAEQQMSSEEVAAAGARKESSKRLRLFGVNLECGHLFPATPQLAKASGHHIK